MLELPGLKAETMNTTHPTKARAMGHPSRGTRTSTLSAWITTGLFALLMTFSGILYVVGPPRLLEAMAGLGYPVYFLKLLGVAKLLGVVGLLLPGRPTLREWAYAGFTFDLLAGAISHVATGTGSHALQPLLVLALLVASYSLRKRAALEAQA
jgi:hypothetical protein